MLAAVRAPTKDTIKLKARHVTTRVTLNATIRATIRVTIRSKRI